MVHPHFCRSFTWFRKFAKCYEPAYCASLMRRPPPRQHSRTPLMDQNLDRLLTALDVAPHAFSVCRVQSGWRMTFPVFKVLTVHFVLQGSGHLGVGQSEPLPFAPSSVLVVPAMQSHWVGDAEPAARVGPAAEKCELIGDGRVEFTAGDGSSETLLLCAAVSAPHDAARCCIKLSGSTAPHRPVADYLPKFTFGTACASGGAVK